MVTAVDEHATDGSAAAIHEAARTLHPLAHPALVLVLLCSGFPGACFVVAALAWLTWRATDGTRPATRRRIWGAGLAGLAGLVLLAFFSATYPLLISAVSGAWLLWWVQLWALAHSRTRPDSPPRRVLLRGFAPISVGLLAAVLSVPLTGSGALAAAAGLLCLLSLRGAIGAMRDLYPLRAISLEGMVRTVSDQLQQSLGLRPEPWPRGTHLTGTVRDRSVGVYLETTTAPAQVTLRLPIGVVPPSLYVRAREDGEAGGRPLADPLLSRLLFIEGLADAALLEGLHEDLLSVLHAWPGSEIRDGVLWVRLPGPPLVVTRGTVLHVEDAHGMGIFVEEQIREALTLAQALHARGCARDISRNVQIGQKQPERG